MQDMVIIGASGLGREILSLVQAINHKEPTYKILGFYDDSFEKRSKVHNFPILGKVDDINRVNSPIAVVIAIGSSYIRRKIADKLHNEHIFYPTIIHPKAYIQDPDTVKISHGVVLAAGAIITCDVRIGEFALININCTVGHDAVIGAYSSFMPTVNISGETSIGEGVYVGTGASIINQVCIGENTIIGAGATVVNNIPANCTAVGTPAKIIKRN